MVNYHLAQCLMGFPGGTKVKKLPANAGDARDSDLIPGSGRSPGGGNGSPLQYSCLRNPMDRGAWQAIVLGIPRVGHDLATEHSSTIPHGYHNFISLIYLIQGGRLYTQPRRRKS